MRVSARWLARRHRDFGTMLPRGWGFAWFDYMHSYAVIMPIPLNKIVSFVRAAYLWLRRAVQYDPFIRAYDKGYIDGRAAEVDCCDREKRAEYQRGVADGRAAMSGEILARIDQQFPTHFSSRN